MILNCSNDATIAGFAFVQLKALNRHLASCGPCANTSKVKAKEIEEKEKEKRKEKKRPKWPVSLNQVEQKSQRANKI